MSHMDEGGLSGDEDAAIYSTSFPQVLFALYYKILKLVYVVACKHK